MRYLLVSVGVVMALSSCADESPAPESDIRPGKIEPTGGAYVSVAVDNHFHDVHLEDDISFDSSRPFVVRNEGSNLHNVTIPEIDYSKDIRPGRSITLRLDAGGYNLICKYHADSDMAGAFTVE